MERVKQREYDKFGDRVREGGDMYEQEQKFFDFTASRLLALIEQYADTLTCPVIYIDGAEDWRTNAAKIAEYYYNSTERIEDIK